MNFEFVAKLKEKLTKYCECDACQTCIKDVNEDIDELAEEYKASNKEPIFPDGMELIEASNDSHAEETRVQIPASTDKVESSSGLGHLAPGVKASDKKGCGKDMPTGIPPFIWSCTKPCGSGGYLCPKCHVGVHKNKDVKCKNFCTCGSADGGSHYSWCVIFEGSEENAECEKLLDNKLEELIASRIKLYRLLRREGSEGK